MISRDPGYKHCRGKVGASVLKRGPLTKGGTGQGRACPKESISAGSLAFSDVTRGRREQLGNRGEQSRRGNAPFFLVTWGRTSSCRKKKPCSGDHLTGSEGVKWEGKRLKAQPRIRSQNKRITVSSANTERETRGYSPRSQKSDENEGPNHFLRRGRTGVRIVSEGYNTRGGRAIPSCFKTRSKHY